MMLSAVGRATVNLFPQFQSEPKTGEFRNKEPTIPVRPQMQIKRYGDRNRKEKDEFFFYSILDYNKEATAKLREVSYIPVVEYL